MLSRKIGLITPLKNEESNIEKLINSIEKQTIKIDTWIIVENGSTDKSYEILTSLGKLKNVDNFKVLQFSLQNEKYELGVKYSTVVNKGFEEIYANLIGNDIDYVGILDADCFPEPDYYEKLMVFFEKNKNVGISSGRNYLLDGTYNGESPKWVTGNCRLWRRECFLDSGYLIGPSADTLSACKAMLKGWAVLPQIDAKYYSRDMGVNVNFEYYGYANYFRGIGPFYASMKTLNYFRLGKIKEGKGFFVGYFRSFFSKTPKVKDQEILKFYKRYVFKKIKELPGYLKNS